MSSKERLDKLLVQRGLCKSREEAQALILAGEVWSAQVRLDKAGQQVKLDTPLEVRSRSCAFVSRAGMKLDHALKAFSVDVIDEVCLDVGASTGGFTDCLLQRGARHVFAVDVGYGQLDIKLRNDPRVTVIEKQNARYLDPGLVKEPSFVTADVSFISLAKIVPAIARCVAASSRWLLLFKPQFEVGPEFVDKNGVVRDAGAVSSALENFLAFMRENGFILLAGPETSPVAGKKSGNVELLLLFEKKSIR